MDPPSCTCIDGYFDDNGTALCAPCNYIYCLTCDKNATDCKTCNLTSTNNRVNPAPDCDCRDKYSRE